VAPSALATRQSFLTFSEKMRGGRATKETAVTDHCTSPHPWIPYSRRNVAEKYWGVSRLTNLVLRSRL
jgi:hypothetical protein